VKKVLIVTPNWPPINCPDLHRVRTALPFFSEFGWEPLLLKVDPDQQEGMKDPALCRTVPASAREWQAGCVPRGVLRCIGVRNVGLRSFFHLARAGDRVIRGESPSVVFFSTTMFPVMTLGRYWHRRRRLPYVLDFQDPWRKGEGKAKADRPGADTQGRSRRQGLKARWADAVAGWLEPVALRRAAHVVSVSPAYEAMLKRRYGWLKEDRFTVLPFGGAENDYEVLRSSRIRQRVFDPGDGKRHWVYVGAVIPPMSTALRALFQAFKRERGERGEAMGKVRLHFVGTKYAPRERVWKIVEPLAHEAGLGDRVSETTDRLPYFEALQCLLDAEALLVPGSDDPGYTASKIFPCILARKPLLAVFREESSTVEILRKTRAGTVVTFRPGEDPEAIAGRILATGWLAKPIVPATDWAAFEPYTARQMTRKLCAVFDQVTAEHGMAERRSDGDKRSLFAI